MEDLRQICLYQLNNETWWDYTVEFGDNCVTTNRTDLKNCSENIYTKKGFKKVDVDSCVLRSFKVWNDIQSDNLLLEEERRLFLGEGIQIWPSIRINNVTYRVKKILFFL